MYHLILVLIVVTYKTFTTSLKRCGLCVFCGFEGEKGKGEIPSGVQVHTLTFTLKLWVVRIDTDPCVKEDVV